MKFFFRITDLNKVGEKFDIFNCEKPLEVIVTPPVRTTRTNVDRTRSNRRRESDGKSRKIGGSRRRTNQDKTRLCDKIMPEESCDEYSAEERTNINHVTCYESDHKVIKSEVSDNIDRESDDQNNMTNIFSETVQKCTGVDSKTSDTLKCTVINDPETQKVVEHDLTRNIDRKLVDIPNNYSELAHSKSSDHENKENKNELPTCVKTNITAHSEDSAVKEQAISNCGNFTIKPDIIQQMKSGTQNDNSAIRNAVYTNITLKRTNNVEIITKIQKVSNKEGQPIGLNIIKQTVKKSNANKGGNISRPSSKQSKISSGSKTDKKTNSSGLSDIPVKRLPDKSPSTNDIEEEKRLFLQSFELQAKTPGTSDVGDKKEKAPVKKVIIQKRKNSSPIKHDKSKKFKQDKKPTKRIIIQCKPNPTTTVTPTTSQIPNALQNTGLQTLIENCKIPSSLSITIKETSDTHKHLTLPPVKNFIEILKLPDENVSNTSSNAKETNGSARKLEFPLKICDNDSEQKVDQDLAEIARSLTEKIPMSTTISQIVGPKQQFPIPTKPSVLTKSHILPSPVPELSSKLLNIPKDASKLAPRSPQTFQKIFEESIKKPDNATKTIEKESQKCALDLSNEGACTSNNTQQNISETVSQLYKKTKLEFEKGPTETSAQCTSVGKVPIPRLPQKNLKPSQKNLKFEIADAMNYQQTVTNLHSNALGMNYTVSVGPNSSAITKVNGTVTNITKDGFVEHSSRSAMTNISDNKKLTVSPNPFSVPKELLNSSPRPNPITRNLSPGLGYNSPRNSPKHSPKSSPVVKHMYAPTPNLLLDPLRVNTINQKVPSPKFGDIRQVSPGKLPSPTQNKVLHSPKLSPNVTKPTSSPSLSPKMPVPMQPSRSSAKLSQELVPAGSNPSTVMKSSSGMPTLMSPSQILEKYNIQNLAQLSASLNFNSANFGLNPGGQLAALQHAMLLKHFEMQNRQNWLNMNQGPLLQYEKYLQSLKTNQNHLLGNIKEN